MSRAPRSFARSSAGVRTPAAAGVAVLLLFLLAADVASGDTVWTRSGQGTNALERPNVKVEKVENGVVTFRSTASDRVTERPLEEVVRMAVDGEVVFNQAEEAFAAGKWDAATAAYQRAIASTQRQWVKDRSGLRLVAAAEKSGKFSAAVAGWLALMGRDPATASKVRPQIPAGAAPGSLGPAVAEVDKALNDGRLSDDTRQSLLAFQMELARANGDVKKAQSIGTRLMTREAAGDATGNNASPGNAAPAGPNPALALQMAYLALDQKQYDKALKDITAAAAAFNDPEQQVEALYAIAEARSGLAKDDPAALKDAALAYMRVVARAKAARVGSARLADSLMKTGALQERLGAPQEALLLYQQVADEFRGTEAATRAAQAADRLGKAAAARSDSAASAP